jgi:vancomycin resistance protein VanJ
VGWRHPPAAEYDTTTAEDHIVGSRSERTPRALRWLVALVVTGALALSAACLLGPQRLWWLELVRYVPYPIHLLAAVGASGLSLFLGRLWRLTALLALVAVLTVVMGLALGRGESGTRPLRVMTYNVKAYLAVSRPDGYSRIAWEIIQADPDIIVMQDAKHLAEPGAATPAPMRTMLQERQVYAYGQYVIASRYPLRDCRQGTIPFREQDHSYARCTVSVAGVDLDLVTVHFLSPRGGLNATRRWGQLDEWKQNFADRMT